ncbi:hypothetical protein [Rhodococcus sp. HNM0569]|uniref:LGFP repeat-containing protein n=1 Tax=Rhodococcus sp. HNM0569 TaxID=2716340 RepID=UPI00146EF970|nr:hypothetical protein [Rhodococcus sp. HNM0569]NLU84869.1 hypothetical protein [Rhodococcus sp. HNM0569]
MHTRHILDSGHVRSRRIRSRRAVRSALVVGAATAATVALSGGAALAQPTDPGNDAGQPSETMPVRPESDGPNDVVPQPPKQSSGDPQAQALPGCADYWNPELDSWFMVCGRILDKYNELGGPDGALGLPTSNELTNPDGVGKRTSFTNDASIYWSPATNAHEIGGAIGAEWARQGWETGNHGYPTTDESDAQDGIGRFNHFQGNSDIYWHPDTGPTAFTVWGEIRQAWVDSGAEGGRFGFPTANEHEIEGGWAQDFQHGTLEWRPGGPAVPAGQLAPGGGN